MVPMVHSDTYLSFIVTLFYNSEQVYSEAEDLDGEGGRHSHEHTNALLDLLDLKTLWDDYGIVGDIIVSRIVDLETHMLTRTGSHSPLWPTFLVRTFMSFYPRISFIRSLREHSRTICDLGGCLLAP